LALDPASEAAAGELDGKYEESRLRDARDRLRIERIRALPKGTTSFGRGQ
jgi:hypothetical protein